MTTPPTAADIDAFIAADGMGDGYTNLGYTFADMWGVSYSDLAAVYANAVGSAGGVMWVVGYTDNTGAKNYQLLGFTGLGSGSDADIESASIVTDPEFETGGPGSTLVQLSFTPVAELRALVQAYGTVTIRGYKVPPVTISSFTPVDSAVSAWVNDDSNWAAPG